MPMEMGIQRFRCGSTGTRRIMTMTNARPTNIRASDSSTTLTFCLRERSNSDTACWIVSTFAPDDEVGLLDPSQPYKQGHRPGWFQPSFVGAGRPSG